MHQLPTHAHLPVRRIDLTFTNNRTVLDGQVAAGGGGGGRSSAVTDATIAAFNDLTIWLDLDPARTLNAAFATCSVLGDLPKHLYSRSPTPAGLILTGNWDFELVLMKAGLLGISRDTNPAQGHGQALNDSSYPTSTWTEEFQVHHIWKSGSNYSQTSGLFKLNNYNCYVWPSGNGAINFKNSSNQNVTLSNINWIPNRVYLLSMTLRASLTARFFFIVSQVSLSVQAVGQVECPHVTDVKRALRTLGARFSAEGPPNSIGV